MKKLAFFLIFCLFILVNCELDSSKAGFRSRSKKVKTIKLKKEAANACEAAFRYLFRNNKTHAQDKAGAYFLVIDKKDPADDFLGRFSGHTPPVKKGSEFAVGKGLEFRLGSPTKLKSNRYGFNCGYKESEKNFAILNLVVEKQNDNWIVVDFRIVFITR